jgi:hypothetical protein
MKISHIYIQPTLYALPNCQQSRCSNTDIVSPELLKLVLLGSNAQTSVLLSVKWHVN